MGEASKLPPITFLKAFSIGLCVLLIAVATGCNFGNDREEARKATARLHMHLQSGDLASVYKEAAPAFREVGSETAFVSALKGLLDRLGSIKEAREVAYQTGWDTNLGATHTLIYNLECEHGPARERVLLGKSRAGKMELLRLDIQPAENR